MVPNKVKESLFDGKPSLGTWIQLGHPGIAEILSSIGFDWIGVDCEHTDIDVKGFTEIARGMHGRNALPLARVRENDVMAIRQVLDAGSAGVIVPMVNSSADAVRAVKAAKFPPEGIRGSAFFRANNYGMDAAEYAVRANEFLLVIAMIETKEAVNDIDGIVSVNGLDGVFIGPYDMSASYGVVGQLDHPVMKLARNRIVEASANAGKAAGIHIIHPTAELIAEVLQEGFTFVALGMDDIFLEQGAKAALHEARRIVEKKG